MLAHGVTDTYSNNGPYVQDVYDSDVVYQHGGQMHKRSYKKDDAAKVTLGEPKKVYAAYVDAKENGGSFLAESLTDEFAIAVEAVLKDSETVIITDEGIELAEAVEIIGSVNLKEAAGQSTIPVKIISPGWGSSGYYSAEVLKRDGPGIFREGLHMHWDHATKKEESERPERSMATLAAVLAEDAKWDDNGAKGPGLYSTFKPFTDFAPRIKEKAKYTGVSINARGKVKMGEAEGRKGPIVESLVAAKSTDFVTHPGAGGQALVEGARAATEPPINKETQTMTEQETASLREAQTKAADAETKLKEANGKLTEMALQQNQALCAAAFMEAFTTLGVTVKMDAVKLLAANPPLKEGKLDVDAVKATAKTFSESFSGGKRKAGIRGLGEAAAEDTEDADRLKELGGYLGDMGLSEAAVKIAMRGGQ